MMKYLLFVLLAFPAFAADHEDFFFGSVQSSHTDSAHIGADANTFTFSGKALGVAWSNRKIVVAVSGEETGAARTISSVTVGGVSATVVVSANAGGNTNLAALYVATVPTGTTGDIVVTWSGGVNTCAVDVYRLINSKSTANATGTDTTVGASEEETASIYVPGGGVAIAAWTTDSSAGTRTTTWTNITEQTDREIDGGDSVGFSSGFLRYVGSQASLAVTATASGALSRGAFVVASFGPD